MFLFYALHVSELVISILVVKPDICAYHRGAFIFILTNSVISFLFMMLCCCLCFVIPSPLLLPPNSVWGMNYRLIAKIWFVLDISIIYNVNFPITVTASAGQQKPYSCNNKFF